MTVSKYASSVVFGTLQVDVKDEDEEWSTQKTLFSGLASSYYINWRLLKYKPGTLPRTLVPMCFASTDKLQLKHAPSDRFLRQKSVQMLLVRILEQGRL